VYLVYYVWENGAWSTQRGGMFKGTNVTCTGAFTGQSANPHGGEMHAYTAMVT
jgi:hypothetical protein